MKKKLCSLSIVLTCLAIIGSFIWLLPPREPEHEGRRLSEWIKDLDATQTSPKRQHAAEAVRAMGTNALPWLLDKMGPQTSAVKEFVQYVGRRQTFVEFTPEYLVRMRAVMAIRALGPAARPAIPVLAEFLNDETTSSWATLALVGIGMDAAPSLKNALNSSNDIARANAAWGLARLRVKV